VDEIWKDIAGFEGSYRISSLGRVWSVGGSRIRKPAISPNGYLKVVLSRGGVIATKYVHRLVAEAFISERCGPEVNHKDFDRLNNTAANLEWCSRRENDQHARVGRRNRRQYKSAA
jgi:hypothetical protein